MGRYHKLVASLAECLNAKNDEATKEKHRAKVQRLAEQMERYGNRVRGKSELQKPVATD